MYDECGSSGSTVNAHTILLLEINEQQRDVGIYEDISKAPEHPVAVVMKKG